MVKRVYRDSLSEAMRSQYCRDPYGPAICEHCDGERSHMVRQDDLRGWVCKYCDSSLDEMFGETPSTPMEGW